MQILKHGTGLASRYVAQSLLKAEWWLAKEWGGLNKHGESFKTKLEDGRDIESALHSVMRPRFWTMGLLRNLQTAVERPYLTILGSCSSKNFVVCFA